MALFKGLFPHPQQFSVHGVTYFLNPGEVKELPDVFRGRYNGLIEEVFPESKSTKEEITEVTTDTEGEQEPDEVLLAVQKANLENGPQITEEEDLRRKAEKEKEKTKKEKAKNNIANVIKRAEIRDAAAPIVKFRKSKKKEEVAPSTSNGPEPTTDQTV